MGRYKNELIDLLFYADSSRCNLFQLQRSRKRILEENFFYQTCRLANFVKIEPRQKNGLKQSILIFSGEDLKNMKKGKNASGELAVFA